MNSNLLHRTCLALGIASLAGLATMVLASPHQTDWIPLFNGKNLDGWTPKFKGEALGVNYLDTFGVRNGTLSVSYEKYKSFDSRFGHLFYKTPYSDYKLRVEYRFLGNQCPDGPGWAIR